MKKKNRIKKTSFFQWNTQEIRGDRTLTGLYNEEEKSNLSGGVFLKGIYTSRFTILRLFGVFFASRKLWSNHFEMFSALLIYERRKW